MSGTFARHFLDWDKPCLPQAARWIIDRAESAVGMCRLDEAVIVVPGRQAGRVLLELLVRECRARGLSLMPPHLITPGSLIDVLLPPTEPIADRAECILAWMGVLRDATSDELAAWLARPPEASDLRGWHALATTLDRLWTELAAESRSFADVADLAGRLELHEESMRWHALEQLLRRYRRSLHERGLNDPDDQRARRLARPLDTNADANVDAIGRAPRTIILVGVIELTGAQRRALARVADRAVALVHAPPTCAEGFDTIGTISPAWWEAQPLPLDRATVILADRPEDQAQAAIRRLEALTDVAADEITIGFGDQALADQLEQAAGWAEFALHRSDGQALARTGPYRLLEVIARWLEEPRFENFASLLRHPDLELWLAQQLQYSGRKEGEPAEARRDWLGLLDRYFTDHLHERLSGEWLGDPDRQRRLHRLHAAVEEWLAPLRNRSGSGGGVAQSLGAWVEPILEALAAIYESRENNGEDQRPHETIDACLAVRDALLPFARADASLQPTCTAATALRLMLGALEFATIPAPVRADQIEALGWLELHLDPAPVLIVVGVNDGAIPLAAGADAFLPDRLREMLGLISNRRRFARDAYLLRAIIESRAAVTLIAGRSSAEGEPLTPSRLLLTGALEELPGRIAAITDADRALRWPHPIGAPAPGERSAFLVPEVPDQSVALESISVTAFSLYLQCPYRFRLRHLLCLREVADDQDELDPLSFGTLAHAVLQKFGCDEAIRESSNPTLLREFLLDALHAEARSRFGPSPMPAVRVQLARLERRLEAFAAVQAEDRAKGWRPIESEYALSDAATLELPDQPPVRVRAKIDRIDKHEATCALRIIDYKTGESGSTPFEIHHGSTTYRPGKWIDLQLPLYEHLYRKVADHEINQIELGYVVLPRKPEDVSFRLATWTSEQLAEAIDTAREVVRSIRAGRFARNPDYRSSFDPFARICQTSVLGGGPDETGGESEGRGDS